MTVDANSLEAALDRPFTFDLLRDPKWQPTRENYAAVCDAARALARERDAAVEALIRCAEVSGEDGEAVEAARLGAMTYPPIPEWALACIGQLRSDYDESLQEAEAAGAQAAAYREALEQIAESYAWEPYYDLETISEVDHGHREHTIPTNRRIARSVLAAATGKEQG